MVRLVLFRHASAESARPGQADFDRKLTPAGIAQARAAGRRLAAAGILPDDIVCSSAQRTRETLALALPALEAAGCRPDIVHRRSVYETMDRDYLRLIAESGRAGRALMLVGHNMAIEATAQNLAAEGAPDALAALASGFPTAGLAVIDLDGDWSEIGPGRLAAFHVPRP